MAYQKFLISIPSITRVFPAVAENKNKKKKKREGEKDSADLFYARLFFFLLLAGSLNLGIAVSDRTEISRTVVRIDVGVVEGGGGGGRVKKQKKKGEKEWGLVRRARSWDHRQCMLPA